MGGAWSALAECWTADGGSLLKAAEDGDHESVQQSLEARPELAVYTRFGNSNSVLHRAAAGGHVRVVAAVIEALKAHNKGSLDPEKEDAADSGLCAPEEFFHAVINQRTSSSQTPLMLACASGATACATLLLAEGADPFLVDRRQLRTALHCAAAFGRAETLRALLSEATFVNTAAGRVALRHAKVCDMSGVCTYADTRSENGYTAVHLAALSGTLPCVQALLDSGASMMVRTVDQGRGVTYDIAPGSTPLHAAAFRGDVGIVQAVLQAHADALGMWNSIGEDGRREWENDGRIDLRSVTNAVKQLPYHVARQRGHRHILRILNPTVPIDVALEDCRDSESGYGPQRLTTLAAYSLRLGLLAWLHDAQAHKELGLLPKPRRSASVCSGLSRRRSAFGASHGGDCELIPRQPSLIKSRRRQRQPGSGPSTPSKAQLAASACSSPTSPARLLPGIAGVWPAEKSQQEGLTPTVHEEPSGVFGAAWFGRGDGSATSRRTTGDTAPDGPCGGMLPSPFAALALAPVPALEDEPGIEGVAERQGSWLSTFWGRRVSNAAPGSPVMQRPPSISIVASAAGFQERTVATLGRQSSPGDLLPNTVRYVPAGRRTPPITPRNQRLRSASEGTDLGNAVALMGRELEGFGKPQQDGGLTDVRRQRPVSQGGSFEGPTPPVSPSRASSRSLKRSLGSLARGLSTRSAAAQPLAEQPLAEEALRLAREASIVGFETAKDHNDCGICLDTEEEVAIDGCDHMLCVECAISLCEVHKKPPLCPFCRRVIHGFHYEGTV